ncbi:D-alanyl-D-alanine carboxypeptidase family protein [Eggerthella sinensis]|uniref:D-alanyl-D-alanine carboxypeptidase family protein n=1 Tax=Eggerthella sinensis TaxID=242230 RepID=UPI00248EC794|nr:D-alanyl-D-alanine carboxypeptidase family protein [Eggerthella sinensis]
MSARASTTTAVSERLACANNLLLVNAAHPLANPPGSRELAAVPLDGPRTLLDAAAARALAALLASIEGREGIVAVSGFRSHAEQQDIWNRSLADNGEAFTRTYVAVPGCSEHESGLAIDLAERAENVDFIRPSFPYDGVCGAFRARAARYGFIERYGRDKEDVTGIGWEPWHFRYVGHPHAALMEARGEALEEYLAFLREETSLARPLAWRGEGIDCAVLYVDAVEAEGALAMLPERGTWSASMTNTGGIVLVGRAR